MVPPWRYCKIIPFLLLLCGITAHSQDVHLRKCGEISAIRKLNTVGSVLYLALILTMRTPGYAWAV